MRRAVASLPVLYWLALLAYLSVRGFVGAPTPDRLQQPVLARAYSLVSLLNEFTPFLFLLLPVWLLTAALVRTRWALLAAALPWLPFALLYGVLFVPRPAQLAGTLPLRGTGPTAHPVVRVMTHNLLFTNRDAERIAGVVREADPDLLMVQELSSSTATALDALLMDAYPYRRLRATGLGEGIWSRYPIEFEELWPGSQRGAQWQHAVVRIEDHPVQVVNLHLTSPLVTGETTVIPVPAPLPDRPVVLPTGELATARRREVDSLVPRLRVLAEGPDPLIVTGDLNMTDQTPEYQRLLSVGLVDAYRQAGWGFGFTFPAFRRVRFAGHQAVIRFPLVRIDYVLGAKIQAQRARVITESTGSDHRPVLAELAVGT